MIQSSLWNYLHSPSFMYCIHFSCDFLALMCHIQWFIFSSFSLIFVFMWVGYLSVCDCTSNHPSISYQCNYQLWIYCSFCFSFDNRVIYVVFPLFMFLWVFLFQFCMYVYFMLWSIFMRLYENRKFVPSDQRLHLITTW